METTSNIENANPFAIRAKSQMRQPARKPLRGLDNRVRNLSVKGSFKEKSVTALKENVRSVKPTQSLKTTQSLRTKPAVKKEVLQNVGELRKALPRPEEISVPVRPDNVEDIDVDDRDNPQLVSIYINEIYAYMRKLEVKFPIKVGHMSFQKEITKTMRAVLVDWLVQVHMRFHLLQETLYMTMSVLDRFLQAVSVRRSELQLVGVSAMFIASKFEEMYAPDIADFVYITDNTYSKQDILNTEKVILRTLGFNLSKPLPLHFLRRNSKAGNVDATIHTLAKYLMELTLPEYDLAPVLPSMLASAALYLSLKLLAHSHWTDTLAFYSRYSEAELMPTVSALCCIVLKTETSKLQAIKTKYSSSKLYKISTIPQLKSQVVIELAAFPK